MKRILKEQNIGWDMQWGMSGPPPGPGTPMIGDNCDGWWGCGAIVFTSITPESCDANVGSYTLSWEGANEIDSIYIGAIDLGTGEAYPVIEGMSSWGIPVMGTPMYNDEGVGEYTWNVPDGIEFEGPLQFFIMQGMYYGPGNNVYDGATFVVLSYNYSELIDCDEEEEDEEDDMIICYKCQNGSPVANQYPGPDCPQGWTTDEEPCEEPCDAFSLNDFAISIGYMGGWVKFCHDCVFDEEVNDLYSYECSCCPDDVVDDDDDDIIEEKLTCYKCIKNNPVAVQFPNTLNAWANFNFTGDCPPGWTENESPCKKPVKPEEGINTINVINVEDNIEEPSECDELEALNPILYGGCQGKCENPDITEEDICYPYCDCYEEEEPEGMAQIEKNKVKKELKEEKMIEQFLTEGFSLKKPSLRDLKLLQEQGAETPPCYYCDQNGEMQTYNGTMISQWLSNPDNFQFCPSSVQSCEIIGTVCEIVPELEEYMEHCTSAGNWGDLPQDFKDTICNNCAEGQTNVHCTCCGAYGPEGPTGNWSIQDQFQSWTSNLDYTPSSSTGFYETYESMAHFIIDFCQDDSYLTSDSSCLTAAMCEQNVTCGSTNGMEQEYWTIVDGPTGIPANCGNCSGAFGPDGTWAKGSHIPENIMCNPPQIEDEPPVAAMQGMAPSQDMGKKKKPQEAPIKNKMKVKAASLDLAAGCLDDSDCTGSQVCADGGECVDPDTPSLEKEKREKLNEEINKMKNLMNKLL